MEKLLKKNVTTFGNWAYKAIAKHTKKILKHEKEVLKNKDKEELHQMRVGMRRLRTAIVGFAPAIKLPKEINDKKVGKIAKVLGKLRDLDVLENTLIHQYQPVLPSSEQKFLNKALKCLKKQRQEAFKEVQKILIDGYYLNLIIGLKKWLDKPKYQDLASISMVEVLPDLLLPQIGEFFLHSGWLVGAKIESQQDNFLVKLRKNMTLEEINLLLQDKDSPLHDLRKEAKRTRYQMELFTKIYGDDYQVYLEQIKQVQEVLGDIQDSFVLADFLADSFQSQLEIKAPILAFKLKENRYFKWQEWIKIAEHFLDSQTKDDFRKVIQKSNLPKQNLSKDISSRANSLIDQFPQENRDLVLGNY